MKSLFTIIFISLTVASSAQEAQPDPVMARMREGMKKLVQRISEADAGRVAAEAAKAETDLKVAELETKLKAAEKKASELEVQGTKDKASSEKALAELNAKLTGREQEVSRLSEALAKWKEGFAEARSIAEAKEKERAVAVGKTAVMERRMAAAETKNAEMFKLAREVLGRYEKFGFGTALLAREPFVRSMKVKLQNHMQDYGDKLDAQRIEPSPGNQVKSAAPPAAEVANP